MSVLVPLRARDGSVRAQAVIDAADAAMVNQWRWWLIGGRYVGRTLRVAGTKPTIYLHRVLMGLSPGDGLEVDHENLNKLDCRRGNLRIVTRGQNQQNVGALGGSSQHRGVTWNKREGKWQAQATINRRYHYLGLFTDEDEAGREAGDFRRAHMPYSAADAAMSRDVPPARTTPATHAPPANRS